MGKRGRPAGEEEEGEETRQWRNSCRCLSRRGPPAGTGYRCRVSLGSVSNQDWTIGQGSEGRSRQIQLPMLRDFVQPPILRDPVRRLLRPGIGASPDPAPSRLEDWWKDSSPLPPLQCLLFLTGSNGPGNP